MRIHLSLALLIGQLTSSIASGQCPTSTFIAPDTVCKGVSVPFTISPNGSNKTVQWDFNCGDSKNAPQIISAGTYPSTIPGTSGFDLMEENGLFIGYSVRSLGLMRHEYGNSVNNAPLVTDLGSLGVIGGGTQELRLFKEGDDYYALINTSAGNLIRLAFGNSLLNTPTGTIITLPSNLFAFPFNMDLKRMGNDVIAAIANISGQNLTIVNFGNSITNDSPAAFNIPVPGASPIAPVLVNDCGNLHAFVAYFSGAAMTRVSFGNTVTATPVQTVNFNVNSLWAYRQANMIHDGLEWLMFANTSGGDQIHVYRFGSDPANLSPAITYPIIASSQDFSTASFIKSGSTLTGVACNNSTGEIRQIQFPENVLSSPGSSSAQQTSAVFNSSGYFYVSCRITDTLLGLSYVHLDSVFVAEAPSASFTAGAGCLNTPASFANTSSLDAVNFQWDFGDGLTDNSQNPVHLYNLPGDYEVTLVATNSNGCAGTFTDTLTVFLQPLAAFNFINNTCAGRTIGLSDASTTTNGSITSWTWIIGNSDTLSGPQPIYAFTSAGQFDIQLVVHASTGCVDTSSAICQVIPGPIASFEATTTCLGDSVRFINNTLLVGGLNTDYLWRFSNLDSSNAEDPVYQFPTSSAGDYLIRLAATSSNGCTDTSDAILHIGPSAIVDFGIDDDTVCTATPVLFSDSSTVSPTETVLERIWDFGDGQQSLNSTVASHAFSSPGVYLVKLTIKTATNCMSSATKLVTVISSPSVGFTTQGICEDALIGFQDTSTSSPTSQINQWVWNFDTLGSSTGQSPAFFFSNPGTYHISLAVTDDNGCFSDTIVPLTIQPRPQADFAHGNACSNSNVAFIDSSSVNTGIISFWSWDFGDQTAGSSYQNPIHVFQNPGAFVCQLITTSSFGCADTATKIVVVDASPQFTLSPSLACFGQENTFGHSFINGNVVNPAFIWDFGDSTYSLQASPTHIYGSPGTKKVVLSISDLDNGCVWTDSIHAIVLENPIADFLDRSICENDTLFLDEQSLASINDPIASWEWKSGVFAPIVGQNPIITGLTPGTYPVQLTVVSGSGCKDSVTKNIAVNELPTTQFTASPYFGAPPLTVFFNNQSDPGQSLWDFNDGSATSSIRSPSHTFQDTGTFLVNLTLTNASGCAGSAQNQIFVLQPFLDLAVNQIEFIETNDAYNIRIKLRNSGNSTITDFRIRMELNSKSPVIEQVADIEIPPGTTYEFVSAISFVRDANNPEYVCGEIINVNGTKDDVPSNDRKCFALSDENKIFDIYPNPVFDNLQIPFYVKNQGRITLSLYDLQGRKVIEDNSAFITKGLNAIELDTRNLISGQYFLRLTFGDKDYKASFIKVDRP